MLRITSFSRLRYCAPYLSQTSFFSTSRKVEILSPGDIFFKKDTIISKIESCGFLILKQNYESSNETFRTICEHFGNIQHRTRSDRGISFVVDTRSRSETPAISSNIRFFPHTDGVYLDDIVSYDGNYTRTQPPKFVILECVIPATEGGETVVIDGKRILEEVTATHPTLIPALFKKSISFFRHEFVANKVSIYDKDKQQRYSIRYSYDQEMLIPETLFNAVEKFNGQFILNDKFHITEKLISKEVIVIDNKRMLHGRSAFCGNRVLRRAWISMDNSEILFPGKTPDASFYPSDKEDFFRNSHLHILPRSLSTAPLSIPTGFTLP